ncbi:class I SAM-dependent methyltransferase [Candidatus Bathyarchaeota archaeon]|nr:class I SAM-dependent methyltransferase [Candidatus Bathyarchaeota archaeon]
MGLSYKDVFKYSDILNPISLATLLSAGKLAQLDSQKIVLDLGSGKGFPSLLWARVFGVQIEGFDTIKNYVEYANLRANMLNLSHHVKFFCKDVKKLSFNRDYDVVASLGLGIAQVYGNISDALKNFKTMLGEGGFLIFAEPVWLEKKVSLKVLNALGAVKEHFLTKFELQQLIENLGFQIQGDFVSKKEDWELYIKPVFIAMREIIESHSELAEEAQKTMNAFEAEHDAVGKYWEMILWVVKIK